MKYVKLSVILSCCLVVMANGISAGDGVGIRASTGSGAASGGDCLPDALVNYDANTLGPGSAITTWANSGTGGSGWDVTQATALDKPTYVASCTGGKPCASFVDTTDYLRQAVAQSVTWNVTYVCVVGEFALTASLAAFAWGNNASILTNTFLPRIGFSQVQGAAGTTRVVSTTAGWQTQCFDMTNPAAPTVSENGGAPTALGTLAGAEFLDPNLFTLGRDFSNTWNFIGGKLAQVVAYNADPGLTTQDLSACLASKWGT